MLLADPANSDICLKENWSTRMIFTMFFFVTVKDMYLLLRNVTFKKIRKT